MTQRHASATIFTIVTKLCVLLEPSCPSILKWTWTCCRGMQHLHLLLGGLELAPVPVDSETSVDDRVATQPARPEDVAIPRHVLDDGLRNLRSGKVSLNAFCGEKYRSRAHMLWLVGQRGKQRSAEELTDECRSSESLRSVWNERRIRFGDTVPCNSEGTNTVRPHPNAYLPRGILHFYF